jgi:hypothetical protein
MPEPEPEPEPPPEPEPAPEPEPWACPPERLEELSARLLSPSATQSLARPLYSRNMDVMDDTTTTENPSSATSPRSSADHSSNRADLEAAVASLHASFNVKGGYETPRPREKAPKGHFERV